MWNIPAESHARVLAALEPYRRQAFRNARDAGERLTDEALMADALDMLARDVLLDSAAEAAASPSRQSRPRRRSRARSCPPPGGGRPTPAPRNRRAPAQVHVLVDFDALRRGYATDGETCEVHGLGPIPVALAEHLMQDSLLRLIVTGTDVTLVSSERRYVPEAVRRALFARDGAPAWSPGCGATKYLELDHCFTDFADGGPTEYGNLAHVCRRDHTPQDPVRLGPAPHRREGLDLHPAGRHRSGSPVSQVRRATNTISRPGRSGASRTSSTAKPAVARLVSSSGRVRKRRVESLVISSPSS